MRRLLIAFFGGFLSTLFGAVFFMMAILVTPPPASSNVYAILWGIVVFVIGLALFRNIILRFIFRKISHSNFQSLIGLGRQVSYSVVILWGLLFVLGLLTTNSTLLAVSFGLFFMWLPIYFIFSGPLTDAGEIGLLFELLRANMDNFEERQPYLTIVSRKVENQFKLGNIKVPQNEFVYYFNMELLKGTDVKEDLKSIESWIVDKKTPCFNSLKKIYPESELKPWRRIPLSRQFVENPELRKYILIVIALFLFALSPILQSGIIGLISKLLPI